MIVNYSISLKALHRYVQAYNKTQEHLKTHIRGSMLHTAQEIIRIYGASLLKANRITKVTADHIPSLRTNNKQLGILTHQSGRTIQRHIKRLKEAGVITHKIGHGSNASYELFINSEILWIKGVTTPKNTNKAAQAYQELYPENQQIKNNNRTKCPHTDSSNTNRNKNNIVIPVEKLQQLWQGDPFKIPASKKNISGNTIKKSPENTFGNTIERSSPQLTSFKTGNTSGNTFSGDTQENDLEKNDARENERWRKHTGDPQIAKEDNTTNSPNRHALLVSYTTTLWKLARKELYKDTHLTHRQCTIGEQLLYQWYASVKTEHLEKAHTEYLDRVFMVKKYLEKDPENRFVQLPYLYFDLKNPSGFIGTKLWYKKQKKTKSELREQRILHHELRKYKRNIVKDTATQRPPLTVYRECEQRIGKLKNEELIQQFYKSISQIQLNNL